MSFQSLGHMPFRIANNILIGGLVARHPRLRSRRQHHRPLFQDFHREIEPQLLQAQPVRQEPLGGLRGEHRGRGSQGSHGKCAYSLFIVLLTTLLACLLELLSSFTTPTEVVQVDWNKAATDFQPSSKITGASFKTSIQRITKPPKSATTTTGGGGNAAKTASKKREAPAAARSSSSPSSPTSESTPSHGRKNRNKKSKVRQTSAEEDDTALPTIEGDLVEQGITAEDVRQPDMGSRASSQSRYATPLVKAEDIDDDAYGGEEDRYEFFAE